MSGGHGGKRKGAGRPPALSPVEQQKIGIWCEYHWHQFAVKRARDALHNRRDLESVRRIQRELAAEPLSKRKGAFVRKLTVSVRERQGDISDHFKSLGISRSTTAPIKRPRGERARIIEACIATVKEEWGLRVTARAVRTCWDNYRYVTLRRLMAEAS